MNQIVCIDTNILSWFLRTCRDQDENKMDRAQALIETLSKDKVVVALPSIVLAEALCFVPDDALQNATNILRTQFPIFQFDELSAHCYRAIFHQTRNVETDAPRWSKAADVKIISTAMAHGATCLYSEDEGMLKLATGIIKTAGLPPLPPQQKKLPISPPSN